MSDTYTRYPSVIQQAIPTVPDFASLPVAGAYDGQIYLTTDDDSLYAWNLAGSQWVILNSASTVTGSGANGKMAVWTGTSSLGVTAQTGVLHLTSGAYSVYTTIPTTVGGTGLSDIGTANQVLGVDAAADGLEYKSIVGTSNQVVVTHGAGTVTLSLPQSIAAGSSPTFTGLTLSAFNSSGVVHNNSSGVLSSSTVVNADIDAGAGISFSKLAALASGNILVGNGSTIPTSVAVSGDITISSAGVTAIGSGKIVNAQINAAAAIAYSKLALSGAILNADINSSAAIAYSKLALTGAILNADVSASAAIAYSKLALTGNIVNGDVSASAAIAYSKLNLSASIKASDVNSQSSASGTVMTADGAGGASFTSLATSIFAPGMMLAYGGSSAPTGWLLCDGSLKSTTTYAALYSAIGDAYNGGVSPGGGNFKLPNKLGRSSIGAGAGSGLTSRTLGTRGGDENTQQHSHTLTDNGHSHFVASSAGANSGALSTTNMIATAAIGNNTRNPPSTPDVGITNTKATGITMADYGTGAGQNMMPWECDTWIIKT